MLEVRPVSTREDFATFVDLPYRLYAHDPHWVPPLRMSEKERLDAAKNPFFAHATMEMFLAHRGQRVMGRAAAIDDPLHNQVHRENVAFFGFFEAEDREVAHTLLARAEGWAQERGRTALRGPVSPSLNDTAGMLVDRFDHDPVVMMPYNPPTYPGWVEAAGYAKAKDLWAWWFDIDNSVNKRARRILSRVERTLDPKPTIRPMRRRGDGFREDVETIHRLFCNAWAGNWGFVPPTEEEFRHAAREMRAVLEWDLALIMEIRDEPVAFSLTLPDVHQLLKGTGGRLLRVLPKMLLRRRFVNQGRLLLLGVVPEYRMKGLEIALIAHSIGVAETELGWIGGECSWTLEDNTAINKAIAMVGARHYKTYRIYEKPLSPASPGP